VGHVCAGKEMEMEVRFQPIRNHGGWSAPLPGRFNHPERPGTYFRGGWMSLDVDLDGHEKFRAQGYPNIGTCSP